MLYVDIPHGYSSVFYISAQATRVKPGISQVHCLSTRVALLKKKFDLDLLYFWAWDDRTTAGYVEHEILSLLRYWQTSVGHKLREQGLLNKRCNGDTEIFERTIFTTPQVLKRQVEYLLPDLPKPIHSYSAFVI